MVVFLCFESYILQSNLISRQKQVQMHNKAEVESRTQDSRPRPRTQKNPRPRTAFPRTDTLKAKDRNARGQDQGPRTQAQVSALQKKKKGLHKNFSDDLQKKKKKGLHKNFSSDLHENTFSKKFFKRSTKF